MTRSLSVRSVRINLPAESAGEDSTARCPTTSGLVLRKSSDEKMSDSSRHREARQPSSSGARRGSERRASDRDQSSRGGRPPPLTTAPPSERRRKPSRTPSWLFYVVPVLLAGAVVGGVAYYKYYYNTATTDNSSPGNLNNTSLPQPVTIVAAGTTWTVDPLHNQGVAFSLNHTSVVTGPYGASVNISVYVMTPTEYHALSGGATPAAAGSVWSQGPGPVGTIFANLAKGSYELVFYNPSKVPSFVHVDGSVQAT